jgi:cytochrome P450
MYNEKLIDDDKLMAPEHFRAGQPHAEWRTLRRQCPVYWSRPAGFRPYWSITRHADIVEVERNARIFLNEPRFAIMPELFESYMNQRYGSINGLLKILVQMDAPEHTKHRQLMQTWFTPKAVMAHVANMEAICHHYFDRLREHGREGEIDFAQSLAFWFPLRVACYLLGTPEEDDTHILELAEDVLSFRAPEPGKKSGFERMLDYCSAVAEDRRRHPREDFSTFLVQSRIDGELLQPREMLAHFLTVATAGHDTTTSAITGGVRALLQNPDQLQLLRDDPVLIASAAEEILRWVTPTVQFVRTAAEDYVLRGQLIRKGESCALLFGSGNRDEEVFDDADVFRITRHPNPHLAFGSGPHSCLGSQLARIELRCFLGVLLERFAHMELCGPTPCIAANLVTRIEKMPMRYRFR